MRPLACAVLLILASACTPQDPDGGPAPPPADAPAPVAQTPPAPPAPDPLPADFSGDIDAVGTEPFWSLSIADGQAALTRPGQPRVATPLGAPAAAGDKVVWTQAADGKPFIVSLAKQACSDGMSDRNFPLTAQVKLGDLTLKGCAAKAGDAPKNP